MGHSLTIRFAFELSGVSDFHSLPRKEHVGERTDGKLSAKGPILHHKSHQIDVSFLTSHNRSNTRINGSVPLLRCSNTTNVTKK